MRKLFLFLPILLVGLFFMVSCGSSGGGNGDPIYQYYIEFWPISNMDKMDVDENYIYCMPLTNYSMRAGMFDAKGDPDPDFDVNTIVWTIDSSIGYINNPGQYTAVGQNIQLYITGAADTVGKFKIEAGSMVFDDNIKIVTVLPVIS